MMQFWEDLFEFNYILSDEGIRFAINVVGYPEKFPNGVGNTYQIFDNGVYKTRATNLAAVIARYKIAVSKPSFIIKSIRIIIDKKTNENEEFIGEYLDRISEILDIYNFKIISSEPIFLGSSGRYYKEYKIEKEESVKENMIYASKHSKSLLEEILELNYILEDDDIEFEIYNGMDKYGHSIYQSSKRKKHLNSRSLEVDFTYVQIRIKECLNDNTGEYYDRVKDICNRHKYNCHKNRYSYSGSNGVYDMHGRRYLSSKILNINISKQPDYKKLAKQKIIKESFDSKNFLEEILNLNHILQDDNIGFGVILDEIKMADGFKELEYRNTKTIYHHLNGKKTFNKELMETSFGKIDVKIYYNYKSNDQIKNEQEILEEYFDRVEEISNSNHLSSKIIYTSSDKNKIRGISIQPTESVKESYKESEILALNYCENKEEYNKEIDKCVKFIKEILDLNYILKDENIQYRLMGQKLEDGVYILIENSEIRHVRKYDYIFAEVGIYFRKNYKLSENDHYQEYIDRLKEIAKGYEFNLKSDSYGNLIFINERNGKKYFTRSLAPLNLVRHMESSSEIDKFLAEIKELEYIINDEGYYITLMTPDKNVNAPRFAILRENRAIPLTMYKENWYLEFMDRVEEIATNYGYKCKPWRTAPNVVYFLKLDSHLVWSWKGNLSTNEYKKEYLNESVKNTPTIKEIVDEIVDISYILKDVDVDLCIYGVLNNNGAQHLIYSYENLKMYISEHFEKMHSRVPFKKINLYIIKPRQSVYDIYLSGGIIDSDKIDSKADECGEFADRLGDFCDLHGLKTYTNHGRRLSDIDFTGGIISIELPKKTKSEFIKSLTESKDYKQDIEKMFDEIKEITYILRDRGYFEDWKIELKKLPSPQEMVIKKGNKMVKIVGEIANIFIRSQAILQADKKGTDVYEDYSEFFDRCKEIVNGFGYELEKSSSASCIRIIDTQKKVRFSKHTSKFTRRIKESVSNIDSLISEISDLSYIMEDEGFQVSVKENRKKVPFNSVFQIELSHNKKFTTLLTQTNYYKEYIDRVREICLSFGYGIHIIKSGMIILTQKITKPRRIMESKQETLKSEIENIFFLLQDEGYKCFSITLGISKEICPGYEFSICFSGGDKKIPGWYGWAKHLLNSDCYIEFIDRLEEICHEHNREAMIIGIDDGFFHADTIRIVNRDEYEDLGWRKDKVGHLSSKEFTISEFKQIYLGINESNRINQFIIKNPHRYPEKITESIKVESYNQKALDVIEEYIYIFKDCGIHPEIHEQRSGNSFKYIGILVSKNSVETITQSDEYEEFMDRIKDELSDEYYVKSMTGNYAWILIERKMNIDGSPKLNEKFSNVTIDSKDISGNTKQKKIDLTEEEIKDVLIDLSDNSCIVEYIAFSNQLLTKDNKKGKLEFEMVPKIEILIKIPNEEFMNADTYQDAIGGFEDYLDFKDLSMRIDKKIPGRGPRRINQPIDIEIVIFRKEDLPKEIIVNPLT